MISNTKFAATVIIVVGAALGGAMVCWELGPLTLELSPDQLALVGSGASALVALVGCCFAIERSEAHARNRDTILRLEWILFRAANGVWRRRERVDRLLPRHEAAAIPQEPCRPVSARGVDWSDPNGELHAEGMKLR